MTNNNLKQSGIPNFKKTYYWDAPNAGDQLTKEIAQKLFNTDIAWEKPEKCEFMGVGSILDSICIRTKLSPAKKIIKTAIKKTGASQASVSVWSTGFMCFYGIEPEFFYRKNITFFAVRGQLTKDIIEKIYAPIPNVVLADGGLLSSLLVKNINKKYKIGIVPHMTELDHQQTVRLIHNNTAIRLIDIRKSPMEVIQGISECETILSSSLHGLIIADSFNIPNKHIIINPETYVRQAFKYKDYYSSYGLPLTSIDLQVCDECPTPKQIIDGYPINYNDVIKKQKQLVQSFPIHM